MEVFDLHINPTSFFIFDFRGFALLESILVPDC